MTLLLIFIAILLLFIFGSILLVMIAFGQARMGAGEKTPEPAKSARFRWRAVPLPVIILVLVAGMCAWFYGKLPARPASSFAVNGMPFAFVSRGTLMMWALLPQLLLTLLALMVAWGVTRLGALLRSGEASLMRLDNLLLVIGNMVALPQLILAFAMLNTFGYNAYQARLVPLWAVVIVVVIAGAIILGVFYLYRPQNRGRRRQIACT
jgi:hypothetical protein